MGRPRACAGLGGSARPLGGGPPRRARALLCPWGRAEAGGLQVKEGRAGRSPGLRGVRVEWAGLLRGRACCLGNVVCECGCATHRSSLARRHSGWLYRYGVHLGLFPFEVHLAIQVVCYLVFASKFPRENTFRREILTFADLLSLFLPWVSF